MSWVLVPRIRMIAMILFVMFTISLRVISLLVFRYVMMETVLTALINVKSAIIVVVVVWAVSIRPVIVLTIPESNKSSAPEASCPTKTKSHKERHQHNKVYNQFYFPP